MTGGMVCMGVAKDYFAVVEVDYWNTISKFDLQLLHVISKF
jgi:hypothetical protein